MSVFISIAEECFFDNFFCLLPQVNCLRVSNLWHNHESLTRLY